MTTPFFLQVDADFVLDPECACTLRDAMAPDVGITVGALRDPLIGPIAGVKLFRRECFASSSLKDTIAPEVDFGWTLERSGWQTRYVVGRPGRTPTSTLGAHQPRYTLEYVFGTYYLLGARYAAHNDALGVLWRSSQLRRSRHGMAAVARIAMGHGLFAAEVGDVAKPAPARRDASFLRKLALGAEPGVSVPADMRASVRQLGSRSPAALLETFFELGASLRATSHGGFRECLRALGECAHPGSWIAEVGLAHGALSSSRSPIPDLTMTTLERLASQASFGLFPRPS
jgi:hypothetical protein